MENRAYALAAGFFTVILVTATALAFWWFEGRTDAMRDYVVVTQQNVNGLSSQAQVRFRGIRVGKVYAVHIDPADPRNILILIRIKDEVPVTRGTVAKLGYQGVTGIAHLALEDTGRDPRPLAGAGDPPPRIAMIPSLLEEIGDAGTATLRQVRDLVASLNQLLGAENRRNVAKTLDNIESLSAEMRPAVAGLPKLVAQLEKAASDENVARLSATLDHTAESTRQAAATLAELRKLTIGLETLAAKLDRGVEEGAPRLQELSTEAAANSRQLNRVLQLLERSPQSVVFGPPPMPPGPGEAGFAPAVKGQP